ncbi:unnamed protein product, partial [Staurois parvus]
MSSCPPRRWRGCLLSAEESGPLLHLSPSAALPKPETVSWKPELGFTMRPGAQVQPLIPLSVLATIRHTGISPLVWQAAFSSPDLDN